MNAAFTALARETRNQAAAAPSQRQRVTRLYRGALRAAMSWAVDREVFLTEAERLRARFDAFKGDFSQRSLGALEQGEQELASFAHPDAYVVPWMPGGSKFMRNPPPPPQVAFFEVDEKTGHGHLHAPENASTGTNTPVWPDMVPVTFRPKSNVSSYLVDFSKKTME